MGYITETRTGTRTVEKQNTGTRTAYRTAYSTMEENLGFGDDNSYMQTHF